MSEDENARRVNQRLTWIKTNFIEAFNFALAKLETLSNFMEFGVAEIMRISSVPESVGKVAPQIRSYLTMFKTDISLF